MTKKKYRPYPLYEKQEEVGLGRPLLKEPKAVICKTDGRFFFSIREAAKFYNCSHTLISLHLAGQRRLAQGKEFMFLFDYDKDKYRWPPEYKKRFSESRKKYHTLRKFRKGVLERLKERNELGPRQEQRPKE